MTHDVIYLDQRMRRRHGKTQGEPREETAAAIINCLGSLVVEAEKLRLRLTVDILRLAIAAVREDMAGR